MLFELGVQAGMEKAASKADVAARLRRLKDVDYRASAYHSPTREGDIVTTAWRGTFGKDPHGGRVMRPLSKKPHLVPHTGRQVKIRGAKSVDEWLAHGGTIPRYGLEGKLKGTTAR